MDDLVRAIDYLGNAVVSLAQTVEANVMIAENDAAKFNSYFAAFEKRMAHVEGSLRHVAKEEEDG